MNSQNEYTTPKVEIVMIETQDVVTGSVEGGEVTPWSIDDLGV